MMIDRLQQLNSKPKFRPLGNLVRALATVAFFASVYYIVLARI